MSEEKKVEDSLPQTNLPQTNDVEGKGDSVEKVTEAGVLLGIVKYVCKQEGIGEDKCELLYDKVVLGEMKVTEFVDQVKALVKDELNRKTLESVEEVLPDYGVK